MVLRRVGIGDAAGGRRLRQRRIDRIAALDAEREQRLAFTPGIADRALGEPPIMVVGRGFSSPPSAR